MAKKLLILVVFAFVLGLVLGNLKQIENISQLSHGKNCLVKIDACAKNGVCGPQMARVC